MAPVIGSPLWPLRTSTVNAGKLIGPGLAVQTTPGGAGASATEATDRLVHRLTRSQNDRAGIDRHLNRAGVGRTRELLRAGVDADRVIAGRRDRERVRAGRERRNQEPAELPVWLGPGLASPTVGETRLTVAPATGSPVHASRTIPRTRGGNGCGFNADAEPTPKTAATTAANSTHNAPLLSITTSFGGWVTDEETSTLRRTAEHA